MAGELKAEWRKVAEGDVLKRSSHAVAAINDQIYLFGGELIARQPKDSEVHALAVRNGTQSIPRTLHASSPGPTPRVGSSLTPLNNALYVFSGRGGTDMSPLSEDGSLWAFTPTTSTWSLLTPANPSAPHPKPRSYHCATSDGETRLFVHAGCPTSGRLRDFWSFDVRSRTWTKLPEAPGPERGGTSLCYAAGKVWRMGGFDGKQELGGVVDSFDPASNTWESYEFLADGSKGPGARSVAALLPLRIAEKNHLVSVFGEADPSNLGHAGAGKMLGDVWTFDLEKLIWSKLYVGDGVDEVPAARGWFGATAIDESSLAVVGGLGEDNERLSDAWILSFE